MLQFNGQDYFVIIIVMVTIVLFLSNAQSLDTLVHQGSTGDTTKEPGSNIAIVPPNYIVE
jgi:hypothetical protein